MNDKKYSSFFNHDDQKFSAHFLWGLAAINICVNGTNVSQRGTALSVVVGAALHPGVRQGVRRIYNRIFNSARPDGS